LFIYWIGKALSLLDMTDTEYDHHFKRIRQMLSDSGDYDNWKEYQENPEYRDAVLNTDTRLILNVPDLNLEFFPNAN